jgi:putative nucleotidyltransferase with HDIG domain
MRFELVQNLKGEEILGKTIYNLEGKTLLKKGTRLKHGLINTLKVNGFYYVYVDDINFDDIKNDEKINNLKQMTIARIPDIFNGIINCDAESFNGLLKIIDDLAEYIVSEGNVNTNLYEINEYDNYTYIHCVDTSIMAMFLAFNLNLSTNQLKDIGRAAILHDIGKLKIAETIINKKGILSLKELIEIKKHPIYGYEMLVKAGLKNEYILQAVRQHHEHIDGTGYPDCIKDDKITKFAKIISICDVFTALSANRSYRSRFNPNEAYEYILSGANTLFDEAYVDKFKETFSIYPLGCCVKLSNGIEGFVISQNKNFPDRPIIRVTYDSLTKMYIPHYEIDLLSNINMTIVSVV